jgi:hypothetical protein
MTRPPKSLTCLKKITSATGFSCLMALKILLRQPSTPGQNSICLQSSTWGLNTVLRSRKFLTLNGQR